MHLDLLYIRYIFLSISSHLRGGSRSSRTRGRMRWLRTVFDARALIEARRCQKLRAFFVACADGGIVNGLAQTARSRRIALRHERRPDAWIDRRGPRSRSEPLTHRVRNAGCCGVTLVTPLVRFHFSRMRLRMREHPAFRAPSSCEGGTKWTTALPRLKQQGRSCTSALARGLCSARMGQAPRALRLKQ